MTITYYKNERHGKNNKRKRRLKTGKLIEHRGEYAIVEQPNGEQISVSAKNIDEVIM